LIVLPQVSFSAEKPLIIAFRGDARNLDPHATMEATTTSIQLKMFEKPQVFKDLFYYTLLLYEGD
jgi:hypothetical protein